ncbi:MAG TPA: folylpolyglutamate synthase/dihydrofolate synthase family protein [Candidatus Methanomethylophilaceae archaeon]|nr:folylpolyglutamate synthase/dihydrofolate synthase family protein [Candidatus Methanomethylophilaceae archaeon]
MIDNKTKKDFLDWLYGLSVHGIKLGLDNITELLKRLDDPQKCFKSIHVTGTDGKGSICATMTSMLVESGVKTGRFISPHVLNFNERISIDGIQITDEELADMAALTVHHVNAMAEDGMLCTFFEVTTAIAFLYFKIKGVEYAVVEVGMGGRFDATNVIIPEVCVISNISMEHTEYLGDTIKEIAFEKAGIIKPGIPCVTINADPVFTIINNVAEENNAPLTRIDNNDVEVLSLSEYGTEFTYKEEEYFVSIPGKCQAKNAAVAIEAISKISIFGYKCRCKIKAGLKNVNWPGRMQRVPGTPFIIDVSHTFAGSFCLCSDIKDIYGKVLVVFGILDDKDVERISKNISEIATKTIITQPDTIRAASSEKVSEAFMKHMNLVTIAENVSEAMDEALKIRDDELILVTGSLYMAGDALRWLEKTYPGSSTDCLRNMKTMPHSPADHRKV